MVPLVCNVDELGRTRELLEEARERVSARGDACAESLALGAMIEVPAAAILADRIVEAADFLSVGTNDLVQHTLAVDRGNRALAHLGTPLHPAVLRLVRRVVKVGASARRSVSICGEMASDPVGALIAVGLGVRELSMEASAIPNMRALLARFTASELAELSGQALDARSAGHVEALVRETLGERLTRDDGTAERS
jgi:phosphotransferase system enzyme I (PtsI)